MGSSFLPGHHTAIVAEVHIGTNKTRAAQTLEECYLCGAAARKGHRAPSQVLDMFSLELQVVVTPI